MKLAHFFLPDPNTHKKAHLISAKALAVYIIFFIFLQFGFNFLERVKPDILGVSSNVNQQELIRLTNEERQKAGLSTLSEDQRLDAAAAAKAQNMFEENYWAHYSPSGKDPWGFILGSGYKFTYAGENLARNFYNSDEVVKAWMASSSHKENIVNSHYQNIGMAVLEGTLNGQPTILVVQEFGSPVEAIAQVPAVNSAQTENIATSTPASIPTTIAQTETPTPLPTIGPLTAGTTLNYQPKKAAIDPFKLTKQIGTGLLVLIGILLILDLYIIRRRAIHRISSHHLPHLAFMAIGASAIIGFTPGSIL